MPYLSRITLYPVKALPGVQVASAALTASGALAHDREYALVDHAGGFVNGKSHPGVHRLPVHCGIENSCVVITLGSGTAAQTFVLDDARARDGLAAALTQHLQIRVRIERSTTGGFPDDTANPGPTLIAEASLAQVAQWYPGHGIDEMRQRFRVNLEVADCPAFWEDGLYGAPGADVPFRIGEAELLGTNPCMRCVVPTRDPVSGEVLPRFQRIFVEQRQATLPPWANRARFDFYYRLSLNTRARGDQNGRVIRVGDAVAPL